MNTIRCSICDATNNLSVSNHGAYFRVNKRSFVRDPADPSGNSMICSKCNEEIVDASREYFIDVEEEEKEDDAPSDDRDSSTWE